MIWFVVCTNLQVPGDRKTLSVVKNMYNSLKGLNVHYTQDRCAVSHLNVHYTCYRDTIKRH